VANKPIRGKQRQNSNTNVVIPYLRNTNDYQIGLRP
jgi:hypothetical protein